MARNTRNTTKTTKTVKVTTSVEITKNTKNTGSAKKAKMVCIMLPEETKLLIREAKKLCEEGRKVFVNTKTGNFKPRYAHLDGKEIFVNDGSRNAPNKKRYFSEGGVWKFTDFVKEP